MMTSTDGRTGRAKFTETSRRFRRFLVGLIGSYAFAVQSLLGGFADFPPASNIDGGLPALELCLNGDHLPRDAPAGAPAPSDVCGNHCLCAAGSQLLLGQASPSQFRRLDIEIGKLHPPIDHRRALTINDYAIAQPRAPPPSA